MSETKWTAGPWSVAGRVVDRPEYNEHRHVYAAADRATLGGTGCIANVRSSDANARLIAAAPELYEALAACMADLKHYAATHGPGPDCRLAAARAALAKARGES